jgi:hypothetical protein
MSAACIMAPVSYHREAEPNAVSNYLLRLNTAMIEAILAQSERGGSPLRSKFLARL